MSVEYWKKRALAAEDRVRRLEDHIRLLESAKKVSKGKDKKVVKKRRKKVVVA